MAVNIRRLFLALAETWLAGDANRLPIGQRLSFDLLVWQAQTLASAAGQSGDEPQPSPRWTRLPLDSTLYRLESGMPFRPPLSLLDERSWHATLPLGWHRQPQSSLFTVGHDHSPRPRTRPVPSTANGHSAGARRTRPLQRRSLDALGTVGERNLLQEAHHKLYVREMPVTGIHTLLGLDEITLISVPDAVHRGWVEKVIPPPTPLPAPTLNPVDIVDSGHYRVNWTAVSEATAYLLQEATTPDFAHATSRYQGIETEIILTQPADCPQQLNYRVRAVREGEISPWTAVSSPSGEPVSYHLQVSAAPDFVEADTIFQGPSLSFTVRKPADGLYFYRIRAEAGAVFGPWSNTCWWVSEAQTRWFIKPSAAYNADDLLAVQRALLRFCAARADSLAVLTMPLHFREEEVLSHVAALTGGEDRVLSFGALYHPWLHHRRQEAQEGTAVILAPPDGVVCGMTAARALKRGAWIAPANEPLRSVVAF